MTEKSDFKSDKYFKLIYSSKMRVKRRVLRMERAVARRLSFLIHRSAPLHDQRLASNLEWLLTWKLKTGCCPEFMWCDGVELHEISVSKTHRVIFKASVWVGPESSDKLYKVPMEGEMILKATGKQFKSYCFKLTYDGNIISACKNLTSKGIGRVKRPCFKRYILQGSHG